jgi:hypothetical protein
MDDAFAGGVCRCQYCGAIQTVPSSLKNAEGSAVQKSVASKTLYHKKVPAGPAASTGQSSGLDELAQAVAGSGSGLASSGLQSRRLTAPPSVKPPQPSPAAPPSPQQQEAELAERKPVPMLSIAIVAGLLLLILLAVGTFFFVRGRTTVTTAGGPTFAGVTINAPSVIYLLDNGNSNDTLFDPLKAACYQSLATLGPSRKFQVALWDNGVNTVSYPKSGLADGTPQEINAARQALADTVATGNSHLAAPLKQALAEHPAAIVIATSKWDLDHDDREALAEAQSASIKLYTFGLGAAPESGDLKLAASASGGQFKHLSASDLNHVSD